MFYPYLYFINEETWYWGLEAGLWLGNQIQVSVSKKRDLDKLSEMLTENHP